MPMGRDSHSSSCVGIWGSFESSFLGIMMKVLTPRTLEMSLQRASILYYDNLKFLFYIFYFPEFQQNGKYMEILMKPTLQKALIKDKVIKSPLCDLLC